MDEVNAKSARLNGFMGDASAGQAQELPRPDKRPEKLVPRRAIDFAILPFCRHSLPAAVEY